jgi:hypothetical protein
MLAPPRASASICWGPRTATATLCCLTMRETMRSAITSSGSCEVAQADRSMQTIRSAGREIRWSIGVLRAETAGAGEAALPFAPA